MSWMDHQDAGVQAKQEKNISTLPELEVCFDGEHYIPVNKNCVDKMYKDTMVRLLIVCDEMAELVQKSGLKTTEGREEDAMKDEIVSIIQSLTQLGRSSGIHCILCTQRNDSGVIPGIVRLVLLQTRNSEKNSSIILKQ